jgi:hypothetical protein
MPFNAANLSSIEAKKLFFFVRLALPFMDCPVTDVCVR